MFLITFCGGFLFFVCRILFFYLPLFDFCFFFQLILIALQFCNLVHELVLVIIVCGRPIDYGACY
jgi:hypothetical protein